MEKKTITNGLKKATELIAQLTPVHYHVLGYPTVKINREAVEVYFNTPSTIRTLDLLNLPSDEFRMYSNETALNIVYTFFEDED